MRWKVQASVAALVTVWVTGGCAARRLERENALALAAADGRILDGCYDCLLEARSIYERLGASKHVNRDTIALRSFETTLLLALREKELQLDWRTNLERARQIAPILPPPMNAQRLLAIADAVLPDGTGRMNDWASTIHRERAATPDVPDDIAWLATAPIRSVVRDYLALALDCSYDGRVLAPRAQPGATQRRPVLPPGASPLIIYRTGICMSADTNMLAAVLALVPQFHEAAYFAGSTAAFRAEEDGGSRAAALLQTAYRRFPRAPGVTYVSGWLAMNLGECTTALRYYDETLAIDPEHELALLNGTVCLSRLRHDSAAISRATRLIALESSSTQPAYYWRAVSWVRLRNLPAARADIERAKALEREPNALTMAGVIENEQSELTIAESDLREALALPRGHQNCTAAWTLGLVLARQDRASDAASMLETAMDCYDMRVAFARASIARLQANPPSDRDYAARRLAALTVDSTDQRTRYYAAAFNAAGNRANAGNLPRAMELLAIAERDAKLVDPVAKLRDAIGRAMARTRR